MRMLNEDYSTKSFALFLKPKLREGSLVFVYDNPGAFYDFNFYLNYPVKPIGLSGEFKHAIQDPEAKDNFITKEDFFKKSKKGNDAIYCLMRKSDYEGLKATLRYRFTILKEDAKKVLIGLNISTVQPSP